MSGFGYPQPPQQPGPPQQYPPQPYAPQQYLPAQSGQPAFAQPQYAPAYLPAPVRPPTPRRQRVAATLAGLLLFPLISIGWYAMLGSIAAGGILAIIDRTTQSSSSSATGTDFGLDWASIRDGVLPWIIGAAVGGVMLWTLGVLLSRVVLGASGHPRPWAVTWTGLLIAAAASSIVDGIVVTVVPSVASAAISTQASQLDGSDLDGFGELLGTLLAWGLGGTIAVIGLSLLSAIGSGLLGWRLMAWAFRSPFADGERSALAAPTRPE